MGKSSKRIVALVGGVALVIALAVPGAALAAGWQPFDTAQASCPMAETANSCPRFVDENDNGVCDNRALEACATCGGYIDENGDGICDNQTVRNNDCAEGSRLYRGCGNGNGCGYIDENGDGVCDNQTVRGNGCGMGRGMCAIR